MRLKNLISILLGATLAISATSCADKELPSDIILSYEQDSDEQDSDEPKPDPITNPNVKVITVNGVSFKMIQVKDGTFMMGATSEQTGADSDESPAHQVTLTKDYYMGETEVTQALWLSLIHI